MYDFTTDQSHMSCKINSQKRWTILLFFCWKFIHVGSDKIIKTERGLLKVIEKLKMVQLLIK